MVDLVTWRTSIGTFGNAHGSKESRLAAMFPHAKSAVISMLPMFLIAISMLHMMDDAGIESNPGPIGKTFTMRTFNC